MNDFIADLESGANQIPSLTFSSEEYDFCAHCRKPLPRTRSEFRRVHCDDYCQVCYEMRDIVSGRQHFVTAHREFEERKKHIKRLSPNGDYFKE